jgi:hypothetical protein
MGHWDGRAAAKENLRLFDTTKKWRRYDDERDASDVVTEEGCARILESALINGLNSTNLLLLTGAGSSFCINNAAGSKVTSKTAPGLKDLWDAVKAKVGDNPFNDVIRANSERLDNRRYRKTSHTVQALRRALRRHCRRREGNRRFCDKCRGRHPCTGRFRRCRY